MSDFDARARDWDEDPMKIERAAAVAGGIRRRVPLGADTSALEYGCGTGLLSFALRAELGPITLADTSAGMLAVVRDKIAAGRYAAMTALHLDLLADPIDAHRFDLVMTLMTLHHIADTEAILGRFYAVTRPGGHLCVADLDREDGAFHGPGFRGHLGFDRDALGRIASRCGFQDIVFDTVYCIRKTIDGRTRDFSVFLMTARRPESVDR